MKFVDYRVEDNIAHVVMNRGPVNALSTELVDEILESYTAAKNDPSVRCLMLESGLPKVFCAGMDLDMMRGGNSMRIRKYLEKLYLDMHLAQYRMGKPTIAVVNGPARAAGVTVAVSCDCIIASEAASFGYPEIDVGVIPAMHYVHLPRQIGRHKAFELCFNGQPIDAITGNVGTLLIAWCQARSFTTKLWIWQKTMPRNHHKLCRLLVIALCAQMITNTDVT